MRTARDLWTPAEDAEIVERYADGGAHAVLPHVAPHRTVDAVVRRASLLRVRRNSVFSHPKGGPQERLSAVPAMTLAESLDCLRLRKWGRYEGAPREQPTPALRMQG